MLKLSLPAICFITVAAICPSTAGYAQVTFATYPVVSSSYVEQTGLNCYIQTSEAENTRILDLTRLCGETLSAPVSGGGGAASAPSSDRNSRSPSRVRESSISFPVGSSSSSSPSSGRSQPSLTTFERPGAAIDRAMAEVNQLFGNPTNVNSGSSSDLGNCQYRTDRMSNGRICGGNSAEAREGGN